MRVIFLSILYILMLFIKQSQAQLTTDVVSIFKMQLFLDRLNDKKIDKLPNSVKGDSLYLAFSRMLYLKIDTLKVSNNLYENTEVHDFTFYKVNLSNLTHNKENQIGSKESNYVSIPVCNCHEFIIAIDLIDGISYRISGFNSNDFNSFLANLKKDCKMRYMNFTTKQFLKKYKVEGVDFECLYNGLSKGDKVDYIKYPCLKICNRCW